MRNKNALVVEDDLEFGYLCVKTLFDQNFNADLCANAERAKIYLNNSKVDVILLDLMLPPTYNDEGLKLFKYLRNMNTNSKTVLMTSREKGITEIIVEAMKFGAQDFLDKHNEIFFDKLIVLLNEINISDDNSIDITNNDIYKKVIEMNQKLEAGFLNLEKSQNILYKKLKIYNQNEIRKINDLVNQGLIEEGEIIRSLDAIRRALKFMQSSKLFSKEALAIADNLEQIINSNLGLNQKFELSFPIIPYFLEYKIEFNSNIDLNINELFESLEKQWSLLNMKNKG